jgi:hypothetical protein
MKAESENNCKTINFENQIINDATLPSKIEPV